MDWKTLISYYPDTDAAGGGVPEGTETKPADAGKDWKAEADRKEQLLRDTQAKLKAFEDAQAEKEKKLLEEQGKFKELNDLLAKEKAELLKETESLKKFKQSVEDARLAELEELLKGLSDEDKETVKLGSDTDAQIKLAKRFQTTKTLPNGGPPPVPGRNAKPQTKGLHYPTMEN